MNVMVIQTGALGMFPKVWVKEMEGLEIRERVKIIQTILQKSARILWRVKS